MLGSVTSITSSSNPFWKIAARCLALLVVVEAITHLGLTVYGIMLYKCQSTPFRRLFFTYVTYFYNKKCGNLTKLFAPIKNPEDIDCDEDNNMSCTVEDAMGLVLSKVAFNKFSNQAFYVSKYLKIYLFFDIALIVNSATVSWYLIRPKNITSKKVASYYVVFVILIVVWLITDLVFTLMYKKDIDKTGHLDTWLNFVKVQYKDLGDVVNRLGTVPSTGSMWMVLFWCRLYGIFMIVNVATIISVGIFWSPKIKSGFDEF